MTRGTALGSVALGVILLGLGLYSLRGAAISRSWPSTDGVVVHSGTTPGRRGVIRADVRYTYTVAGRTHTGTRVADVFFSDDEDLAARYPVGTRVRVYYDPADPGSALLQRPGLLRGMLALATGLTMMIYYYHVAKRA